MTDPDNRAEIARQVMNSLFSPVTIAVWFVVTVACVFSGPFGTYAGLTLGERAVFWPAIATLSTFAGYGGRLISTLLVGTATGYLRDSVHVFVVTCLITPVVWSVIYVSNAGDMSMVPSIWRLGLMVAAVSVTVVMFRRVIPGMRPAFDRPAEEPGAELVRPRLADRLSDPGAGILRLTVEDHFVDVISDSGRERLRMRFADAVNEMEPVDGFCTHRSHWVASAAVEGPEREQGKLFLRLRNGDRVPVSRKYRGELKKAGLLEPLTGANRADEPRQRRRA